MKKLIVLVIFLLILPLSYLLIKKMYLNNKFKNDYERLEQIILEKDSENRGYSDVVKEKIHKLSSDPMVISSLEKAAISKRNQIRANNSKDYLSLSIKAMLMRRCAEYAMSSAKIEKSVKQIIYDNQEMHDYYEYLDLFKFNQKELHEKITDWMNNNEYEIDSLEKYEKHCK